MPKAQRISSTSKSTSISSGTPRLSERPLSRSMRVYQKIAVVFVVLSFLLLLGVLYLSIASATVRVTPSPSVISTTVSAEVSPTASALGEVGGVVIAKNFTKAKTFTMPADGGTPIEGKAGGMVTLINDSGAAQPLIATTRLLSEEGVLFRIDSSVTVPAKGSIDVMAHADLPGKAGDIGATQFTIPGLPASSQKLIYAVSVDPMKGGVQYVHVLTTEDLDQAGASLKEEILTEAQDVFRKQVDIATLDGEVFRVDVVSQVSDTQPGTQTGTFTISIEVAVTAVFFDRDVIVKYAEADLYNRLQDGFDLAKINKDGLQVEITLVDAAAGRATISIYLDGLSVISENNEALSKDRLVGHSPDEVRTLLLTNDAIKDANVTFTPFWLKRVPTLKDHIEVIVEDLEE